MTTLPKNTTLIAVTPLLLFAAAREASAALIQYEFGGTVGFSSGFSPSYNGLEFSFNGIVDTETESLTEFDFTMDTRGTWSGTGGTAIFSTFGSNRGTFGIDISTNAGATYSSIVDGFTPTSSGSISFNGSIQDFGGFIDGFPTTFNLGALAGDSGGVFFGNGSSAFVVSPSNITSAMGSEVPETVPEPTTPAAALAGVGALMAYRRNKSQRES